MCLEYAYRAKRKTDQQTNSEKYFWIQGEYQQRELIKKKSGAEKYSRSIEKLTSRVQGPTWPVYEFKDSLFGINKLEEQKKPQKNKREKKVNRA